MNKEKNPWKWQGAKENDDVSFWYLVLARNIELHVVQDESGRWRYSLAGGVEMLWPRAKWITGKPTKTASKAKRDGVAAANRWLQGMMERLGAGDVAHLCPRKLGACKCCNDQREGIDCYCDEGCPNA